jgi:hypothetical protein
VVGFAVMSGTRGSGRTKRDPRSRAADSVLLALWAGAAIWVGFQPVPLTSKMFYVALSLLVAFNSLLGVLGRRNLSDVLGELVSRKVGGRGQGRPRS